MLTQCNVGDYLRAYFDKPLEVIAINTKKITEFPECPHCGQDYPVDTILTEITTHNGQVFQLPTASLTEWYPADGELCFFKSTLASKSIVELREYDQDSESHKKAMQDGRCAPFFGNAPKFTENSQ